MLFILEILAVATLVLWGIGCVAVESYLSAFGLIIALLVGAWFAFGPVKTFVHAIGWKVLLFKWLPLYLLIGVAVAFVKWLFYIWRTADKIRDAREDFTNKKGAVIAPPSERRKAFVSFYMERVQYSDNVKDHINPSNVPDRRWDEEGIVAELLTPRAKKHVDRITFWVLEWPYVIVATLVDDILRKFARTVARLFDWAFTTVSRFWIHRVVKDL